MPAVRNPPPRHLPTRTTGSPWATHLDTQVLARKASLYLCTDMGFLVFLFPFGTDAKLSVTLSMYLLHVCSVTVIVFIAFWDLGDEQDGRKGIGMEELALNG